MTSTAPPGDPSEPSPWDGASGPTASPRVNRVIHLALACAAGTDDDTALRDAVEALALEVEARKRPIESAADRPFDSVLVAQEAARLREAMALQETALDQLWAFFETRDTQLLHDACEALVDAMRTLDDARSALAELAQREGQIVCVRCSRYNERDRRTCEQCGARLLQPTQSWAGATIDLSEEMGTEPGVDDDIAVG